MSTRRRLFLCLVIAFQLACAVAVVYCIVKVAISPHQDAEFLDTWAYHVGEPASGAGH